MSLSTRNLTSCRLGWAALLVLIPVADAFAFGASCISSGFVTAQGGQGGDLVGLQDNKVSFDGCGGSATTSGTVLDPRATDTGEQIYVFEQEAFAQSAATGTSIGQLRVMASASAESNPLAYSFTAPGGGDALALNNYQAHGTASATAQFTDTIFASGPGNRISLRFTLDLHGVLSRMPGAPSTATSTEIMAQLSIRNDRGVNQVLISTRETGVFQRDFTLDEFVPYEITGVLGVNAAATAGLLDDGHFVPAAFASVNALNTGLFLIEAINEGAGFSAASGHLYVAPVPIPPAIALFGSALASLRLVQKAARKREHKPHAGDSSLDSCR